MTDNQQGRPPVLPEDACPSEAEVIIVRRDSAMFVRARGGAVIPLGGDNGKVAHTKIGRAHV